MPKPPAPQCNEAPTALVSHFQVPRRRPNCVPRPSTAPAPAGQHRPTLWGTMSPTPRPLRAPMLAVGSPDSPLLMASPISSTLIVTHPGAVLVGQRQVAVCGSQRVSRVGSNSDAAMHTLVAQQLFSRGPKTVLYFDFYRPRSTSQSCQLSSTVPRGCDASPRKPRLRFTPCLVAAHARSHISPQTANFLAVDTVGTHHTRSYWRPVSPSG